MCVVWVCVCVCGYLSDFVETFGPVPSGVMETLESLRMIHDCTLQPSPISHTYTHTTQHNTTMRRREFNPPFIHLFPYHFFTSAIISLLVKWQRQSNAEADVGGKRLLLSLRKPWCVAQPRGACRCWATTSTKSSSSFFFFFSLFLLFVFLLSHKSAMKLGRGGQKRPTNKRQKTSRSSWNTCTLPLTSLSYGI